MSRNIWLISKYAGLPKYGIGARLVYLAREFTRAGHTVTLITSDANHLSTYPATKKRYNSEHDHGVQVCWVKTKKYRRTASVDRVLSWLDFERKLFLMPHNNLQPPDIVIVSSLSLLSIVFGYYLKRKYKAFLVFEVRDIWPLTMMEEGGFSRLHPLVVLLGNVERFGYRNADLIVGTMPRLDRHVRQTIGRNRLFFCSPLGFDSGWEETETPLDESFFRNYVPEGKTIVGYAGSIGLTNALDPFVRCIELLAGRDDIHFVFVGGGDLKREYSERLARNSNVSFGPRLSWPAVPSFLRRCDILYLSTHDSKVWEFGQSLNKLVDYMLAGRPVIASYSGYQSMLNEAEAGVFIPAGDVNALVRTITKLADMPKENRIEMGARGRQWILANRSYKTLARTYLEAIEQNWLRCISAI